MENRAAAPDYLLEKHYDEQPGRYRAFHDADVIFTVSNYSANYIKSEHLHYKKLIKKYNNIIKKVKISPNLEQFSLKKT